MEVRHGTRLEGPVFVGARSKVLGGFIRASVFGPECRVHGEIAASVFLGYANKSHDGFVGHSVVGHWVNLGAADHHVQSQEHLRRVRLEVAGQRIETGRQNLGTLFGDHAKTAIGTMLATGTVVGAGANVFGPAAPPKYVPPFAWGGEGAERLTRGRFPPRRRARDDPSQRGHDPGPRSQQSAQGCRFGAPSGMLPLADEIVEGGRPRCCEARLYLGRRQFRAIRDEAEFVAGLALEDGRAMRVLPAIGTVWRRIGISSRS